MEAAAHLLNERGSDEKVAWSLSKKEAPGPGCYWAPAFFPVSLEEKTGLGLEEVGGEERGTSLLPP